MADFQLDILEKEEFEKVEKALAQKIIQEVVTTLKSHNIDKLLDNSSPDLFNDLVFDLSFNLLVRFDTQKNSLVDGEEIHTKVGFVNAKQPTTILHKKESTLIHQFVDL